jgi:hypothetical protein
MPPRPLASLWRLFHKGEKQNLVHFATYCKACVEHHTKQLLLEQGDDDLEMDDALQLERKKRIFKEGMQSSPELFSNHTTCLPACELTGSTRGERSAFIAHILGRRGTDKACPYASKEAINEAKAHRDESDDITSTKRPLNDEPNVVSAPKKAKTMSQAPLKAYNALEMPLGKHEKAAVRVQALRAVISANLPFRVFEDIEVLKLFSMLRQEAPAVLPSRKVLAGSLLNEVSGVVDKNLAKILHGQDLGLSYVQI